MCSFTDSAKWREKSTREWTGLGWVGCVLNGGKKIAVATNRCDRVYLDLNLINQTAVDLNEMICVENHTRAIDSSIAYIILQNAIVSNAG